jgi:hypothetical protein
MNANSSSRESVLLAVAQENYEHARDHENLRAQVTATLVAAAFVLIGLSLDREPAPRSPNDGMRSPDGGADAGGPALRSLRS